MAVAPLIVIAALTHFYTTCFQGKWLRLASRLIVPPLVILVASTCWMADILVVYSAFKQSSDVSNVVTKPSYWLYAVGPGFQILTCQLDSRLRLDDSLARTRRLL